jgi:hypothetical protein
VRSMMVVLAPETWTGDGLLTWRRLTRPGKWLGRAGCDVHKTVTGLGRQIATFLVGPASCEPSGCCMLGVPGSCKSARALTV